MHSFLSRMIWSILSSALKTTSVPELLSRLFSFMRTVAELRPPRLYSVFSTTIGSLPCMMTLPARISWAIFMASMSSWSGCACGADAGQRRGRRGAKPSILAFRRDEAEQRGVARSARPARRSRQRRAVRGARRGERARAAGRRGAPAPAPFQAREQRAQRRRQRRRRAGEEAVEEGLELGRVRAVVLRIDLPDERRAGPDARAPASPRRARS